MLLTLRTLTKLTVECAVGGALQVPVVTVTAISEMKQDGAIVTTERQ